MSNDLITSLISSLLPILITVVFAWISSRNDQAKRRHVLDDAKQRIELISAYVASQNLVLDDPHELGVIKKTAANELYEIKAFLDTRLQSLEKSSEKSENYFQRFFLLYKMRTRLAGFFRVCFFLMAIVSIVWSFTLSSLNFTSESVQEYGLGFNIALVLILSLPVVLVALLLRWLAIKYDKPASSTQSTGALQ